MKDSPLSWKDNTPVSNQFDDIYFSLADGLSESRYVFLEQNNLSKRWQQLTNTQFCILETGFGTGLNFLASWHLWEQSQPQNKHLHFVSIEKYPLKPQDAKKALSHWPELHTKTKQLCEQLPPNIPGWHTLQFGNITLTLIYADITDALAQINNSTIRANAVFLDGFSPAKNPDMWTDQVLTQISDCCAAHASLTTFTAVGRIRRSLQDAGFKVEKTKGHGKKREMLKAVLVKEPAEITPTWCRQHHQPAIKTAAVIGAGIAGCHTAYRLAERGIKVTVFEKNSEAAMQASGNPQAVLFIKLSAADGMLGRFSLKSFLHAQRFYKQLQTQGLLTHTDADLCGMLQLYEHKNWQELKHAYGTQNEWLKFLTPEQASHIAGSRIEQHALWFKDSGWIAPKSLCKALLQHPSISCKFNHKVDTLSLQGQQWQLSSVGNTSNYDSVILSNAVDAQHLIKDYQLPFKTAPGQITLFEEQAQHSQLNCVVCKEGYIAPPIDNTVSIGASFRMKNPSTDMLDADHQLNISNYVSALPDMPIPREFSGRVAVRTASTDYLPLAGPMPDTTAFVKRFAALGSNAKKTIKDYGCYHNNLFLLAGLGSRGLTYAPLCADIICEHLTLKRDIMEADIQQALNPARFLTRGLKRGTVDALL